MTEKKYIPWLISAFYAYFFVFFMPWTDILGREFVDIINYHERIGYLYDGGKEAIVTGFKWLMNEPLWEWIIRGIGYIFPSEHYRFALYCVSFIILLLTGSFLFRRVEFYIGMLFLFNPMSVNLYVEQVRSSLAFALILVAYDIPSKRWAMVVIGMSFLIHVSMPIFLIIYYSLYRLNQKVEARKFYLIAIVTAIGSAIFVKYGVGIILAAIGDRHAGYEEVIEAASLSYSIIWIIIAFIVATFAQFETEKQRILAGYAITMMTFFFVSSVLGLFAQRFLALTIPVIIIAIGYLPKHFKQVTYVVLFAYNGLMFKYWLTVG